MRKSVKRIIIAVTLLAIILLAWFLWRSLPRTSDVTDNPFANAPVIAPAIASLNELEPLVEGKPVPSQSPTDTLPPLDDYDHQMGNIMSSTVIFLYSDIPNAYGALLLPELIAYVGDLKNDAVLVFRHFPQEEPASNLEASLASECLRLQAGPDVFWAYLQSIMGKAYDTETLVSYAVGLDAEEGEFRECIRNKTTWNYVLAHRQQAELRAGITVSPSIILWHRPTNDVRVLIGANPMSYIRTVLDEMRK